MFGFKKTQLVRNNLFSFPLSIDWIVDDDDASYTKIGVNG